MFRKVTIVIGALFLLIGILGFVPAATPAEIDGVPLLFGLFSVEIIANFIHIISGVIALLAASSERYARWYLQIFGIIYASMMLIGLLPGSTVLGLFTANMADTILNLVLGISMLGIGITLPATSKTTFTTL